MFIVHRVNLTSELSKIPKEFGVEIDVRPYENKLILSHDPYLNGDSLESFLEHFSHGTIIVNIKSFHIEQDIIMLFNRYNISDYFFLDLSIPNIHGLIQNNFSKFAIRTSIYEPLKNIEMFQGKAQWIWVDHLDGELLTKEQLQYIKELGFKICLVSPCLLGKEIKSFQSHYASLQEKYIDKICCKMKNISSFNV